jgi:hypothetical protein
MKSNQMLVGKNELSPFQTPTPDKDAKNLSKPRTISDVFEKNGLVDIASSLALYAEQLES